MATSKFTITVTNEGDGLLWGHVEELPGCFASGADMNELLEALAEAIGMYLAEDPDAGRVAVTDPGVERRRARPTVEVQGMRILVEA